MKTIDYFISLNSPWTYLGAKRFRDLCEAHDVGVITRPLKPAALFAAAGGQMLSDRPPQRKAYRMMELKRWREALDMPIVLEPKNFPSDETSAAHMVIAAQNAGLDALALSHEIGRGLWEHDCNLADKDALGEAAQRAGIDVQALQGAITGNTDKLNAEWEANTQMAIGTGVFGVPAYVFSDGEIFWGQDRLDLLERRLTQG